MSSALIPGPLIDLKTALEQPAPPQSLQESAAAALMTTQRFSVRLSITTFGTNYSIFRKFSLCSLPKLLTRLFSCSTLWDS